MVFGIRDICDAVFRAHHVMKLGQVTFQKGEPVFTIETAKTSSLEGTSTTVYATGGRGNNNIIAWDGEKQITFNVEDATLSPQSFAVLANAGLIHGATGTTEEVYIPMSSDTYIETRVIDLTEFLDVEERITENGMIYVKLEDEDHTLLEKLPIAVKVNTEEVDGVAAGKGLVPKVYDYSKPDENTFETLSQHELAGVVLDIAPKYKYEKLTKFTPIEIYDEIVNATSAEGSIYRVVEAFNIPEELKVYFAEGAETTEIGYYQVVAKRLTKMNLGNQYLTLPQALTFEDVGKYFQVEKPFNTASNPEFFYGVGGEFKAGTQVKVVLDGEDFKYSIVTSNENVVGKPVYVSYYILQNMSNVDELQVAPEGLSGTYYVEARTLFRRKNDGVDLEARITIPNAHIQSNFTMQMDAGGDPSTFAFTVDCFPGYTYFNRKKKVLAIIQIINESKAEDKSFSVMKHNHDFVPEEKKWDSTTGDDIPKTLMTLAVKTLPVKRIYGIGEQLDTTGLILTAIYTDGTVIDVTDNYLCSGFDSSKVGICTVNVTYERKTTSFDVIIQRDVEKVEIETLPDKTEYFMGESFSQTGLSLKATFIDGSTSIVTDSIVCTGFNSQTAGTQTITATYCGKSTTFEVVVKKIVDHVDINTLPDKTDYNIGETFSAQGLSLLATYTDGSTEIITENIECTGFDSTAERTVTITATYGGKSTTFEVIIHREIKSIAINTPPDKVDYMIYEFFDQTGLSLLVTYTDESTEIVTENIACSGYDGNTEGDQTITVTYGGKTTTFMVHVTDNRVLQKITLTKTDLFPKPFEKGQEWEWKGCVVTAYFEDGTTDIIMPSDLTITGFKTNESGVWMGNIKYKDKTTELVYCVGHVTDFTILTGPNKVTYQIGEEIDWEGFESHWVFADGYATNYPMDTAFSEQDKIYVVSGFDSSTTGVKTVVVSTGWDTISKDFRVQVV